MKKLASPLLSSMRTDGENDICDEFIESDGALRAAPEIAEEASILLRSTNGLRCSGEHGETMARELADGGLEGAILCVGELTRGRKRDALLASLGCAHT